MRTLHAAAVGLIASGNAAAQAVTWDGDCGTFWLAACGPGNSITSWDSDSFPGPTDDVIINGATVSVNTNEDVGSFNINGGGLTIGGSRTLTMNNGGFANSTALGGRFKTFTAFTLAGDTTLSGELYGPGEFVNTGTLALPGIVIGDTLGTPTTLRNDGTATLTFGPVVRPMSEYINNGTTNLSATQFTGSTFTNDGDIVVPTPRSTLVAFEDFRMTGGSVLVDQSAITFRGNGRYSGGTMTANFGGTIGFDGVNVTHRFEGLGSFGGEGEVSISTGGFSAQRYESPIAFNMTGDGLATLSGSFASVGSTVTNTGNLRFQGLRFEQLGGGSFINEAGGEARTVVNAATQLATDIPVTNRGRFILFSSMTSGTNGVFVDVNNETGGEWEMVSLPGAGILFNNSGTVYRRPVSGVAVGTGTIPGTYSQTNGLTRLEAASTTFGGGGTWTDSELEVLDASQAFFTANPGPVSFNGDNTIEYAGVDDVTRVTVGANTEFAVSGTLRFSGNAVGLIGTTIPVNVRGTILGEGEVINEGSMRFDGAWRLGGSIGGGIFRNQGNALLAGSTTPSPQITMDVVNTGLAAQAGDIDVEIGTIDNQGRWEMLNGVTLDGPTTFTNTGELLAAGGTSFEEIGPSMTLDNQGTVRVAFIRTTLTLRGPVAQLVNGTLTGGNWIVEPGCRLIFPGGTVLNTIGPGATVSGSTDDIPDTESLDTVGGTLDGTGPLRVAGSLAIENGGEIIVRPPEGIFDSLEVPDEFRNNSLGGGGRGPTPRSTLTLTNTRADGTTVPDACMNPISIDASSFVNEDLIDVGPNGEIVSADINAPVTLAPTSTIRVDIAGPMPCTEHDQLRVAGSVDADGTIEVTLRDGFVPQALETFEIITATGGVSGQVPEVVTTNPVPGVRLVGSFDLDAVQVVAFCAADTNLDGTVTPADFNSWIIAFNNQAPACDQNADGLCSPADFNAWILNYNSGC